MILNKDELEGILKSAIINHQKKLFDEAEKYYKKIISYFPNHETTLFLLGTLNAEKKNYEQAIKYFKVAIKQNSKNPELYYNYAMVLQENKQYEMSIESYKKAINLKPKYPKAYNNLGYTYKKINKLEEANKNYEKAISLDPNYTLAHKNNAIVLNLMCKDNEAILSYKKAVGLDPSNLLTRWSFLNMFPTIYKNQNEILYYEAKFKKEIISITELINQNNNIPEKKIMNILLSSTNFFLHYQNTNTLKLQKIYAKAIEALTIKIFNNKIPKLNNLNLKKIKIGFISSTCFIDHSVSSVIRNWILKLNQNIFDIYIYNITKDSDAITDIFKKNIKNFISENKIEKLIKKLVTDKLDILVYPDIGMDPKIQVLASLRLAKIQCQTLGHPVSSCFKNIDYFLSSELMETKDSEKYYNEKLIKLPNTAQCFDYPQISIKPKKHEKNKEIIFFSLQNLFKLLPEDDYLFLEILKNSPKSKIWIMEGKSVAITNKYKSRLKKTFYNNDIDFEKRIIFQKRLGQKQFFNLIQKSDIIIDSLNWSGNCTTHQAIALEKPIITMPGKYMRSRHSYALLKRIQLEETIAYSIKEYVEIAKKISHNEEFKNGIINKIKKNKKILFNDISPIISLEKFFIKTVKNN